MGCNNQIIANLPKSKNANIKEKISFPKHITNLQDYKNHMNRDWQNTTTIPCRKCIGCKLDKAKEWAIRSTLETKESNHNYFITLTYNNKNIPNHNSTKNTDLKKFINSLRKQFERKNHKNIKYIASNEYGSKTLRPHYHICFFNLPLIDLTPTGEKNNLNQPYFISKTIDKLWNKGLHKIGLVTYESAGYVARYTLKK